MSWRILDETKVLLLVLDVCSPFILFFLFECRGYGLLDFGSGDIVVVFHGYSNDLTLVLLIHTFTFMDCSAAHFRIYIHDRT